MLEKIFNSELLKFSNFNFKKYTGLETQPFKDAMIGDIDFIEKYMLKTILHEQEIQKLLTVKKLRTQEVQINTVQALNVDSVIMKNNSRKEISTGETTFSKSIKESSLALSKEDLKGTLIKHGFKRAFLSLFGQGDETFTSTMLLNVDQLQKQLDKDEFQEDGSMAAFWVLNKQFHHFINSWFSLDYDSQMTNKYFVKYTGIETQESKVAMGKTLDAGLVVTKTSGTESKMQDESSRSGNDTDADDADIRPVYNEEPMAEFLKEKSNEAKVKHDIDVTEIINIELEYSVAKLLIENEHLNKENEHLKKTYKDLYDSIKKTRVQTKEHNDSLTAQLNKKIIKNVDLKAQIQEKVFAIAALKNELRKLKGNSVDTKFSKPSILGKPLLQSLRNQSVVKQPIAFKSERPNISKPRFASQVDVKNYLSKPATPYYLPKVRESALAKPDHMIASRKSRNRSKNMPRFSSNDKVHNHYLEEAKNKTQERDRNSNTSMMPSTDYKTLLMVANQNLGARIK
ncbi:hypothetical protein Tco_0314123 [Tanacetum coccineum]